MKLTRLLLAVAGLLLLAGAMPAADGKLMHCFAFTAIDSASPADWQAWYKATDALPGKIPGLTSVWYGKLRRSMAVFNPDAETRKKFPAGTDQGSGNFNRVTRQYGACMEFADEKALETYASHPAHKEWEAVYGKVRQPGTSTFDIIAPK